MTNRLVNALNSYANTKTTENGATALSSTNSALYDMFALGGAYRTRSEEDCILLFKNAFEEAPLLALKCLFYMRDIRGGQGERRFFKVCLKWLAINHADIVRKNFDNIAEYGRWDDFYTLVDTPMEKEMFKFIRNQINLDLESKTPSLLAKWLKSENTSSAESCALGNKTRIALGLSHKQYRKVLSHLRQKINIVERLMSANQWDKIEFDKIPSKAGLIYRNAFARRDIIKEKYRAFAADTNTKVNAGTLYPYEVVQKARECRWDGLQNTDRLMVNKYWDNLTDYFNGCSLNALAVVDTSGSMWGQPLNVAISLGLYTADKAKGPFHDHFISFSSRPTFIKCEGVDFVDKVDRIYDQNLCENTNLEATFDLVLNTALQHRLSQSELPASLIVISDMEIDFMSRTRSLYGYNREGFNVKTDMAAMRSKWERAGYKMPSLIYWNINARNNTILDENQDVTYVSGFSSVIFEEIMSGKRGYDLMLNKLNSDRYSMITL